jgi:hypothetical protein
MGAPLEKTVKHLFVWGLLAPFFALVGAVLVLKGLNGSGPLLEDYAILGALTPLVSVGLLIVSRRTRNLIGWILLGIAFSAIVWAFSSEYARYALLTRPGTLPLGLAFAWVSQWSWVLYVWPVAVFLPLLFPNGRLPSPRWKAVAWFAIGHMVTGALAAALTPGPIEDLEISNPLGLEWAGNALETINAAIFLVFPPLMMLVTLALLLRFRQSRGDERAQLKWFLYAAALFGLYATYGILSDYLRLPALPIVSGTVLFAAFLALFALAIGIAILKYRLYDIDIIIRRTLIYAILTAALALAYFVSVVLLQSLFRALTGQAQSELVTVVSTLAIAALFVPLRNRVQDFIDRRFYRKKYDAVKTLAAFAATARDEVELEKLTERLVSVVDETMQPRSVMLWLAPFRVDSQKQTGAVKLSSEQTKPPQGVE